MKIRNVFFFLMALNCNLSFAGDPFCRVWYSEDSLSKIKIYKEPNGKYNGILVWIKHAFAHGKPKIDSKNPDRTLRHKELVGLKIVSDLQVEAPGLLSGGKVYDPTSGNYYNCRMTIKENHLQLRGYIMGLPFLGRTTSWWLAE
jgi:uncharacterized protein (DUF2147 family)